MLKKTILDMGRDSVEEFRRKEKIGLTMVLDNIRSLNNIGSIFRTSDAFRVERLLLCGITATPPLARNPQDSPRSRGLGGLGILRRHA